MDLTYAEIGRSDLGRAQMSSTLFISPTWRYEASHVYRVHIYACMHVCMHGYEASVLLSC